MYRRIAAVPSLRDLDTMRAELVDRFGPIPAEVEHLLALIALRLRCEELGIESIIERERTIVIRPVLTTALDARTLNQALGRALRLTPNSLRLYLPDLEQPWQTALDLLLDEIERALPSTAA
jgi:transcription-repair coupling factor (superfamily II helicase)